MSKDNEDKHPDGDAAVPPDFGMDTIDAILAREDGRASAKEIDAMLKATAQKQGLGAAQIETPEGPEATTGIEHRVNETFVGRLDEQIAANPNLDPRAPAERPSEERPSYVDPTVDATSEPRRDVDGAEQVTNVALNPLKAEADPDALPSGADSDEDWGGGATRPVGAHRSSIRALSEVAPPGEFANKHMVRPGGRTEAELEAVSATPPDPPGLPQLRQSSLAAENSMVLEAALDSAISASVGDSEAAESDNTGKTASASIAHTMTVGVGETVETGAAETSEGGDTRLVQEQPPAGDALTLVPHAEFGQPRTTWVPEPATVRRSGNWTSPFMIVIYVVCVLVLGGVVFKVVSRDTAETEVVALDPLPLPAQPVEEPPVKSVGIPKLVAPNAPPQTDVERAPVTTKRATRTKRRKKRPTAKVATKRKKKVSTPPPCSRRRRGATDVEDCCDDAARTTNPSAAAQRYKACIRYPETWTPK